MIEGRGLWALWILDFSWQGSMQHRPCPDPGRMQNHCQKHLAATLEPSRTTQVYGVQMKFEISSAPMAGVPKPKASKISSLYFGHQAGNLLCILMAGFLVRLRFSHRVQILVLCPVLQVPKSNLAVLVRAWSGTAWSLLGSSRVS